MTTFVAVRQYLLWVVLLGVGSVARAAPESPPKAPAEPRVAAGNASDSLLPHLSFDHVTGMTKGAVTAIAQDSAGFIWFGAEEGLSRYDGHEFINYVVGKNPENTLSSFTVNALAAGKDALWIGTAKGLDRLDLASGKFTHYYNDPKDPKSIGGDDISSLYIGANGIVWIGTAAAGVDSLDPSSGEVRHYRALEGRADTLSDDAVAVVLGDPSGKLWVGAREAGLNLLDPATGKVVRYAHDADIPGSLSNDQVTSLYLDSAGALWVGTIGGLNRLDPSTRSFRHYFENADSPYWVTSMVEGADGGWWLGCTGV